MVLITFVSVFSLINPQKESIIMNKQITTLTMSAVLFFGIATMNAINVPVLGQIGSSSHHHSTHASSAVASGIAIAKEVAEASISSLSPAQENNSVGSKIVAFAQQNQKAIGISAATLVAIYTLYKTYPWFVSLFTQLKAKRAQFGEKNK